MHNVTMTEYEYGEEVDWSRNKAFPSILGSYPWKLINGSAFTLVGTTRLDFDFNDSGVCGRPTTDAGNDSLLSHAGAIELGRVNLPTQYTTAGNTPT
jgi:hypothetical protein